ncbi:MAG: TlpA family protein disulfide reductase [Christensenellaceae bacterium]|nr:TlpA family protein disulfide reductase [Christensenellaceae bacterium]
MKKKWIFLVAAVVFVSVIAGAVVLYNELSERMTGQMKEPQEQITVQEEPIEEKPETVETAPNFTVINNVGKEVQLKDYFGKPIVLNFWATWCGPCKMELPYFNEAYLEYGEEIEFVMVNLTDGISETVKGVRKFMSDNDYSFPVHFDTDGNGASTYGAYSIPMTVFIDAEGTVIGNYTGVIPENVFREYIGALRGE